MRLRLFTTTWRHGSSRGGDGDKVTDTDNEDTGSRVGGYLAQRWFRPDSRDSEVVHEMLVVITDTDEHAGE